MVFFCFECLAGSILGKENWLSLEIECVYDWIGATFLIRLFVELISNFETLLSNLG